MSRWAIPVDLDWGVPLDVYLKRGENLSIRQHPLDRVLSAIRTITTKNPSDTLYDSTLEAFLSVIYYPECLNLLNAKSFRDIWFTLMEKYLRAHSASLVPFIIHLSPSTIIYLLR